MLIQLFCFYFIFVRICQASLKLFSFFKVIVVFQMIFKCVFFLKGSWWIVPSSIERERKLM